MATKKTATDIRRQARIIAEARDRRKREEQSHRARALKLFPHICARCGREFSGKKLRELTVHHKDHDHDHNPPDGSNWELLCLYCHDNEHARYVDSYGTVASSVDANESTHNPFADLKSLLDRED